MKLNCLHFLFIFFFVFWFQVIAAVPLGVMDLSKRVSRWSLEDVLEWLQDQHPGQARALQKVFIKHAISGTSHACGPCGTADDASGVRNLTAPPARARARPPGRALLRLRDHHLERLGLDTEEQLREIWQDLLLLRVQEEICELEDLYAGKEADLSPLLCSASRIQPRRKQPPAVIAIAHYRSALSAPQTVFLRNGK